MTIEGTNTVQGVQNTSTENTAVTFTITDPDHAPGTGDETATDAVANVAFDDMTWTAGPASPIEFREDTVTPQSATVAAIRIVATIGGVTVRFGCNPGIVNVGPPETITLTDPAPSFASNVIVVRPPTITTASLSDGEVGLAYSQTLAATGGTPPYAWSISAGTLPDGLTLDGSTGAITGTPTTAGTSSFTVQVMDSLGATDTADLSITIAPPVVNDFALDVIVNGPVASTKASKNFVGKVTNAGTGTLEVCDTDITVIVTVNGNPTGSTAGTGACATLGPGASKRFKLTWTYGAGVLTPGDAVSFAGALNVPGDPTPGNNVDTEDRIAT
jgi:hypothetical protein